MRALRQITCLAAIALASAASSQGAAQPMVGDHAPATIERSVLTLLSGYEHVPSAANWRAIGPEAAVAATLMKVADAPGHRLRALRATASLAHFHAPDVRAYLESRAGDATRDLRLRGRALMALGAGFKEPAAQFIVPFLAARADPLRADAIRALRPMAAPNVEALLRSRAAGEPRADLKQSLVETAERIARNRAELLRAKRPVPATSPLADPGPVPTD